MGLRKSLLDALPVRLIRKSRILFDEDGLVSQNAAPFLVDPTFIRAYAAGDATGSWGGASIRWRAHVILWAAASVRSLTGDFAECGVNRGGLSRSVVEKLDWNAVGKRFYLLDTFEGFDPRFPPEDLSHWDYSAAYENVKSTFADFPAVVIIKGAVPDTLTQIDSTSFAFVHIDMNALVPEIAALEFFWPKLVPGGILILDDYGFPEHREQQRGHDAFARANGFEILALPTGQGLALKR